ncbi:hypothetical protein [Streptomyces sp. NPDC091416]|uniref:hypothetical protein n=1 Tax=Streptomyces sp. NPDC091416 TaxID=3366003 RepID=UPI00382D97CA
MSATLWFTPWKPGPAADAAPGAGGGSDGNDEGGGSGGGTDGAAVVSVTEFTPHRPLTAVGVTVEGIALRRIWQDLEGAVGLWLWADPDPFRPRSGSVSVWRTERDLQAFVARRDHMRIVRSYRNRGSMRATTWRTEGFDRDATQEAARALLSGRSAWPA